jgi:hypothetical protein
MVWEAYDMVTSKQINTYTSVYIYILLLLLDSQFVLNCYGQDALHLNFFAR